MSGIKLIGVGGGEDQRPERGDQGEGESRGREQIAE